MSKSVRRAALRTALAVGCSVVTLPPAIAQETARDTRAAALEEITVTARRREESLQDAPISVTALSGDALREQGVADLRGISNATPNMEFSYAGNGSGGGNFAQVFLRGVGQPDFIITKDPGVGIYIDGVYLARAPGSVLELLDVERIEVLRGPQGTLFGKNTIGGAVLVTTKKPTDEVSGVGQITLGSYDRLDVSGSLSFPLVEDTLAVRVSAMSRTQDGYYKRLAYEDGPATQFGSDISREAGNNTDRQSGRLSLMWTPSESVEVILSGDVTKERQDAVEYQMIATPGFGGAGTSANIAGYNEFYATPRGLPTYGPQWITTEPWTTYSTWPGYNNSDVWGTSLAITWDAGPVEFKSITAYRDLFVQSKGDADGTPAEIVSSGGIDISQHQFSQELQLSGVAFDDAFNWIAGLWYFDEKARDTQRSRQQAGLFEALEAAPLNSLFPTILPRGCAAPCAVGGAGNPNNRRYENSRTGSRLMQNSSYAVFAHGTYAFTDRWSATAGVRLSHEEKEFDYFELLPLSGRVNFDTYANNPAVPTDEWDIFTPKVGLEYKPADDVLLYLQGSTGFKAGGYNGRPAIAAALQSFDEEELTSYEAGIKSQWLDDRLRLNGAVFFSEYTGIQVTRLPPDQPGVRLEENAGDGETLGFELETVFIPLPGLNLGAGIGYQDFELTSLEPGVQLACQLDCKLPFAPELTANLSAAYTFALGALGDLTMRLDYKYSDEYYIDADNTEAVAQDAYDWLDGRLGLAAPDGAWEVFVGGTNMTDEPVIANGVTSVPNNSQIVTYKPPRQWYAGIRVSF